MGGNIAGKDLEWWLQVQVINEMSIAVGGRRILL